MYLETRKVSKRYTLTEMQVMHQVVIGLDVAEAAFNPTPGDSNGVDQDLYEQNGNDWIRWFLRLALSRVKTMNL